MSAQERIRLAHGGGGLLMHSLIEKTIASVLKNPVLELLDDSAVLDTQGRLAFTSDSYVVRPIFFEGGDIGRLAVCGTVNDLAMQGAEPTAISLCFIIEEGFALGDLKRIVSSVARAAREADVIVATGDVKVVEKGAADGLFVNTAGIGAVPAGVEMSSHNAREGDVVLINGHIADHGVSILCEREGMEFGRQIRSDCAPLSGLVREVLSVTKNVRCMKDPTRGGLASALNEIARSSNVSVEIDEAEIPIRRRTRSACEMLGLDPLVVANEGKVLVVCPETEASRVVDAMRENMYGRASKVIGRVSGRGTQEVMLKTFIGGHRVVDMPYGELLPRIC